ncbi:MAG: tetratricopeptide repeat protein [Pseudoflavonifractor sp.]|nr:tetratricopeptide repeat protein [Alloprevotella sp.]MCM1116671.1 tetratricopeptide repeat protein [Pseudoflavonifractor sp.]
MRSLSIIIALLLATALQCLAAPLTERADSAYSADDFDTALSLYRQELNANGASAKLWYNIGNTEYRLGNLGKAIIAYQRSLRLDPTDEDTRANLDFVTAKTLDRPGDNGSFISNSSDAIASLATPDTWAWGTLLIFCLCIACVVLYIFGRSIALRKAGFFGAIVLLFVTVASAAIALRAARKATSINQAVITASSTILSTSPREPKDRSEEAMLLHEGTLLEIIDSVAAPADTTGLKWLDVRIDNHHRAWIRSSDVERI